MGMEVGSIRNTLPASRKKMHLFISKTSWRSLDAQKIAHNSQEEELPEGIPSVFPYHFLAANVPHRGR